MVRELRQEISKKIAELAGLEIKLNELDNETIADEMRAAQLALESIHQELERLIREGAE